MHSKGIPKVVFAAIESMNGARFVHDQLASASIVVFARFGSVAFCGNCDRCGTLPLPSRARLTNKPRGLRLQVQARVGLNG